MKLGIKVSLQPTSIQDIESVHPAVAEVWFDISRADEYTGLFGELKKNRVETGLHFWGALPDGTMANLAYPDKELNEASIRLIQKAIDIAADNGFVYVNIHPGSRAKVQVDFQAQTYRSVSKPENSDEATKRFLAHAKAIRDYADSRHVVFTVETVSRLSPSSDWYNPASRLKPLNIYDLPIEALELAAQAGISIANDFVHTSTHAQSDKPGEIWAYLADKTRTLQSRTRLIHLGFLVPPYNGVDNHDELDNPVFHTIRAIPNYMQTIELVSLFKNSNVWVITEPKANHAKNYRLAQKLLSNIPV